MAGMQQSQCFESAMIVTLATARTLLLVKQTTSTTQTLSEGRTTDALRLMCSIETLFKTARL